MGENDITQSEGRIHLNLTNFAQYGTGRLDREVFSEPLFIRGLPWRLVAIFSNFSRKRYLGIFLKCNDQSDDLGWSCHAKATVRIHSMAKGKEDFAFKVDKNFTADCIDQGSFRAKEFETLVNPENGWLDDEGAILISADINAEMAQGIHTMNTLDSLFVNGMKLEVNKNHLLLYAPNLGPFFANSPLAHRGIQLDHPATVEHFKRMMASFPPQNRPLDDECIEGVMHLASRFSVGIVEGICRNYLAKECKKSQIFKYRLASKYGFELLKDRILTHITKREVEENMVQNLEEYRKLEKEDADALNARIGLLFGGNIGQRMEGERGEGGESDSDDSDGEEPAMKRTCRSGIYAAN